jgi:dCTP deaminase
MLSDGTIRQLVKAGTIGLDPCILEAQLQPASVDVRLDREFLEHTKNNSKISVPAGEGLVFTPGMCVLGSTMERLTLPATIAGRVEGKSTWGRKFLTVHVTAGFIDPGFDGNVTLEMCNLSNLPITVYPGSLIAQLSFHYLDRAALRPYGHPALGSHYQHQRGVTRPWN